MTRDYETIRSDAYPLDIFFFWVDNISLGLDGCTSSDHKIFLLYSTRYTFYSTCVHLIQLASKKQNLKSNGD